MKEDLMVKLVRALKLWKPPSPEGVKAAVDRDGNYYLVAYTGIGDISFNLIKEADDYFPVLEKLLGTGALVLEPFKPIYELGFKEAAYLRLSSS